MLTDDELEAILSGESNGSTPAEYARIAQLVRIARSEPEQVDEREATIVSAIAAALQSPDGLADDLAPVIPLRARRRARVAVVAAVAAVSLSVTAAAAATDHLPGPVQKALSNAASRVGVDLPDGDAGSDHPATPPASEEESNTSNGSTSSPSNSSSDTAANTSSNGVSDNAPPAVNPSAQNDDGVPGNSAQDQAPGDIASEAHSDNPASQDDVHAQNGQENSTNSSSGLGPELPDVPPGLGNENPGEQSSLHSDSIQSDHRLR